jgi:hypothetical protein
VPEVTVPDLLGAAGRQAEEDRLVAEMLAGIQRERVRLDVLQRANDHDDDDVVPDPGPPMTYASARRQADQKETRLVEAFGEETMERLAALRRGS